MDAQDRDAKGISLFEVDRGGDITYHGPGQLVGYPILYLGHPSFNGRLPAVDYLGYLRKIEGVLIRALVRFGIGARQRDEYTGVWVDPGPSLDDPAKVAAIGVKVDAQGISQHGFALNVAPDLSFYSGIVPCGIHDCRVTSMQQLLSRSIDIDDVAGVVIKEMGREFGLHWQSVDTDELMAQV
jgi:lipoate-protein ligase B